VTNTMDKKFAFTRRSIPDRGRLIQSEVVKRLPRRGFCQAQVAGGRKLAPVKRGRSSWQAANKVASRQMDMHTNFDINSTGRALMSLQKFGENTGISNVTAWGWRRKGWLLAVANPQSSAQS
jgi:hypothetical protein